MKSVETKHEFGQLDLLPKMSAPMSKDKGRPLGSYCRHFGKSALSLCCRSLLYMLKRTVGETDISVGSIPVVMDKMAQHNLQVRHEVGCGKVAVSASMKRDINNFYGEVDHDLVRRSWHWLLELFSSKFRRTCVLIPRVRASKAPSPSSWSRVRGFCTRMSTGKQGA